MSAPPFLIIPSPHLSPISAGNPDRNLRRHHKLNPFARPTQNPQLSNYPLYIHSQWAKVACLAPRTTVLELVKAIAVS